MFLNKKNNNNKKRCAQWEGEVEQDEDRHIYLFLTLRLSLVTVNGSQIIVIPRCGIRSFKKFPMEERKEKLT